MEDEAKPSFTFFKFPVESANVFYWTEHSFAMVNLRPIKPGHLLVAPRRVVPLLADLTEDEAADLMKTIQRIVKLLKPKLGAAGFSIASQEGGAAGQTVAHCHYHVIAREETAAVVPTEEEMATLKSVEVRLGLNIKTFPQMGFDVRTHTEARPKAEMAAEAASYKAIMMGS